MSVRKLSVQEISEVSAVLNDKESIGLLKKIRDNVVQEGSDDTKGKKNQQQENVNFIGFTKGDSVFAGKDGYPPALRKIIDLGLAIESYHLEQSGEQKLKFQITETGSALLAAAGEGYSQQDKPGNEQQKVNQGLADEALGRSKKAGKEFVPPKIEEGTKQEETPRPEQSKPNKARFPQGESNKTNGNEIEDFKAEQNKELRKK